MADIQLETSETEQLLNEAIEHEEDEIHYNENCNDDDEFSEMESPESLLLGILKAINDAKYVGLFTAAFFGCVAFYLSTYKHIGFGVVPEKPMSMTDLKFIRPVISEEKMEIIRSNSKYAESEIILPGSDAIKLRHFTHVPGSGNVHPPMLFFDGVTFGITAHNPHDIEFTSTNKLSNEDLYTALTNIRPKPTHIMSRTTQQNATGWKEQGFAVYYDYNYLAQQGKISADIDQPFSRILQDIIAVARDFKQAYVTIWYPHTFGLSSKKEDLSNKVLMQQVEPTRTGLNGIKSKVPVWMSAHNYAAPEKNPVHVYRKVWTEDDHWSKHLTEEGRKLYEAGKLKPITP